MQSGKAVIMRRAWAIFRQTYNFPRISFRSIGRRCFASCLRRAWDEAKRGAATATRSASELRNRAEDIRRQIADLTFAPFGIDAGRERDRLNALLAPLTAELARRVS